MFNWIKQTCKFLFLSKEYLSTNVQMYKSGSIYEYVPDHILHSDHYQSYGFLVNICDFCFQIDDLAKETANMNEQKRFKSLTSHECSGRGITTLGPTAGVLPVKSMGTSVRWHYTCTAITVVLLSINML